MAQLIFLLLYFSTAHAQRLPPFQEMASLFDDQDLSGQAWELNMNISHIMNLVASNKFSSLLEEGFDVEDIRKVQALLMSERDTKKASDILLTSALLSEKFLESQKRLSKILSDSHQSQAAFYLATELHSTLFHFNHMNQPSSRIYDLVAKNLASLLIEAVPHMKQNPKYINEIYIRLLEELFADLPREVRSEINQRIIDAEFRNFFDIHALQSLTPIRVQTSRLAFFTSLSGPPALGLMGLADQLHTLPNFAHSPTLRDGAASGVVVLMMFIFDKLIRDRRKNTYRAISPAVDQLLRDCRFLLTH